MEDRRELADIINEFGSLKSYPLQSFQNDGFFLREILDIKYFGGEGIAVTTAKISRRIGEEILPLPEPVKQTYIFPKHKHDHSSMRMLAQELKEAGHEAFFMPAVPNFPDYENLNINYF